MKNSDYKTWSSKELYNILTDLGFKTYARQFRIHDIKGSHLPSITEDHLKEMDVLSVGHRLLLMKKIKNIIDGVNPTPVDLDDIHARPSSDSTHSNFSEITNNVTEIEESEISKPQYIPPKTKSRKLDYTQNNPSYPLEEDGTTYDYKGIHSTAKIGRTDVVEESNKDQTALNSLRSKSISSVECPYCLRSLPENIASRHITVCQKIRSKV